MITTGEYRTLGLRATLSVDEKVLESKGIVRAGDSRAFFAHRQRLISDMRNGQSKYPVIDELDDKLSLGKMADLEGITRVGSFLPGSVYECSFLPTNERIQVMSNFLFSAETELASVSSDNNLFQMLTNTPAVLFALSGLPDDASFSIGVDWAIELAIDLRDSIGYVYANARFAQQFNPDWGDLMGIRTAGRLGVVKNEWNNSRSTRNKAALAKLVGLSVPLKRPKLVAPGAMPV